MIPATRKQPRRHGIGPLSLRFVLLSLIALTLPGCAAEDEYPSRPVTLICPWSVGGGTDRVSRQMAHFLEQELGVPVNVVNATGGRGVTGHSRGLRARPDGYTLTMMTVELNMLHWQDLTEISWQDATPLMSINEDAAAVFVRDEAPWQTMNDLLAEIKENPQGDKRLTASGTAAGGIWHLALAGWLQSQGLPLDAVKWIPKNGAGPSLQELMSGGLDLVCCSLPEAESLAQSGRVRALGVMAEQRVPGYPDVPTFNEQGMDWTMVGWRGLGVPKGTPQERVDVLVKAVRRIVTGQTKVRGSQFTTFPEFMQAQGFNNRWRPPDEFRAFLRESDEKFGQLLTSEAFSRIASKGIIGPMAYPYLLFGLLGLLLAALAAGRVIKGPSQETVSTQGLSATGLVNAGMIIAAVAVYVLLAERLGFVITAGVILFGLLCKFGTRVVTSAVITVLFVPAVYQLFAHLLRVPLPRGLLGW